MYTQLAQAGCVSTYIEERKNHEKKHNRYNMERLGTNVREIKEARDSPQAHHPDNRQKAAVSGRIQQKDKSGTKAAVNP